MDSKESASGGVGLTGVVFIVFLILKLCDNIHWSWWWVTSPLWIPFVIALAIMALACVFICVAAVFK